MMFSSFLPQFLTHRETEENQTEKMEIYIVSELCRRPIDIDELISPNFLSEQLQWILANLTQTFNRGRFCLDRAEAEKKIADPNYILFVLEIPKNLYNKKTPNAKELMNLLAAPDSEKNGEINITHIKFRREIPWVKNLPPPASEAPACQNFYETAISKAMSHSKDYQY